MRRRRSRSNQLRNQHNSTYFVTFRFVSFCVVSSSRSARGKTRDSPLELLRYYLYTYQPRISTNKVALVRFSSRSVSRHVACDELSALSRSRVRPCRRRKAVCFSLCARCRSASVKGFAGGGGGGAGRASSFFSSTTGDLTLTPSTELSTA